MREQKSVYELEPDYTVVEGMVGQRLPGQGLYDFDNYVRLVEFEVVKNRAAQFEKFVIDNVAPAAQKFLPKLRNASPDRLPNFLRHVNLEVHQARVKDFYDFAAKSLVPAAQKTKISVFFYRAIYAGGDNFSLLFPYEKANDLANTKNPLLPELLTTAYGAADGRRLSTDLGKLIIRGVEWVSKIRPDMSSNLENKYSKWW